MSRILAGVFGLVLLLAAVPAFCDGPVLWQDPETGQLFSKPADGRVQVDPVKDLQLPASAVSNLYEDETGALYSKPGAGRSRLAATSAENAPVTTTAQSSQPGDYSGQAFADAVKNVVSEQESKTFPKVKLGGEAYVGYSYDFDNEDLNSDNSKKNKFSLNRGYINLKADLTPEVSVRITPDISRISSDDSNNGDYAFRLKYYYASFHNFLDMYPSLKVKLGQFEGAWLDHEEHLWTYRVQGTMLVEREGFMNSANLGVSLDGKLPAGYGEWQALVDNGEGYHADEPNKYKSVQGRLTIHPLPNNEWTKGLEIDGFTYFGRKDKRTSKDIYIAFLGYKLKDDLFVGAEYLRTHGTDGKINHPGANNVDGGGFSAFGWYRMPFYRPVRLMARYDHYDHDLDLPDNTVNRYIYGVSYDLNKYVTFLLDHERTVGKAYRGGYASSTSVKDQNLLKVDVLVKF